MAVADDAEKPSPTRTVVAGLALVPSALAPMLALVRVAAQALAYLGLATAWVLSVICAAASAAHLASGEDSATFVSLLALMVAAAKVCAAYVLVAVAAVLLCLLGRRLVQFLSGSGSEFNKSAFGAVKHELTRNPFKFPRAIVLGLVADLPFFLLIAAGCLMVTMMPSPAEGCKSRGEMIGSVIADVGVFGIHVISCFVIPAVALSEWRQDKTNMEEPSQFLLRQS